MIDILDIVPGESYACHFRARHIPLDDYGRPGGMLSTADLPIKQFGDYEGFGFLKQRDLDQRLVVVVDSQSGVDFVCSFDDIWDIDTVELVDD